MTHPHHWLRAAHKIAPNGALLPDISYYRSDRTERSRPFPTSLPKVHNLPSKFIDRLDPLKQNVSAGFSLSSSSPLPCPAAKRPQSRCEKFFSLVRHSFPVCIAAPLTGALCPLAIQPAFLHTPSVFRTEDFPCALPVCKRPKKRSVCVRDTFPYSWSSKPHKGSQPPLRAFLFSPALPLIRSR